MGRQKFKQMEVQNSAALVIQQNVLSYLEVRDFSWWKLFLKIKPMLAIWRAEEDIKDRDVRKGEGVRTVRTLRGTVPYTVLRCSLTMEQMSRYRGPLLPFSHGCV